VGCDVLQGVAPKSLLKVRLRCKTSHAEERAAFRSTPPTPQLRLPQSPQNQLQLAKCTCRKSCLKICVVGCGVGSGVLHAFQLRYFSTASASPQNQANCSRPKICAVGCGVLSGGGA